MSRARSVAMAALACAGVLVVLSGLQGGRGILSELVTLLAMVAFAFFAGRAGWRWWRDQPAKIVGTGLIGALGVAGAGWLLVALVHALSRVRSDNYGMIVVWPLVYLIAIAVLCGGVLAAGVGVAIVVTASARTPPYRMLFGMAGAAAVLLNFLCIRELARLLLTG